ncbi:ectonucleotide pyrophosphatase/phosphodiesterase 1 [Gaeumannomyces tritici R3-111a-1]|uniref:Ectonucleotide pyrophosphatase/phosphodiesterase 1 n=1 Tax=Gaeumannomyces tritici (strain R3-111a-1) TaxID=644352 RepID=J3PD71_GAET3|nr:ectonucleotide pyrophosphatase/phosphodiesterase 1 [Gaeumannomyces tritici R3-111a-1]EJT70416.1 ectonucleotide pyrophosphatase/phosphodiesterase 1 [Gaeumannomyces tritici R3-111a-1]
MLQRLTTSVADGRDNSSLLSPVEYDADARSIRSDQDSDSDDDQLQLRARNSRELRAHDRMVFMEEDETDKLVLDARRRQTSSSRRRSSNITIPNPLDLLRKYSDTSRSVSPATRARLPKHKESAFDGGDPVLSEKSSKRRQRRARRKQKKDRLLAEAQHGEDGELMYEMEEGGVRDGSSTGESSEREDSDEVDRRGLRLMADDTKSKRRRCCCRWALIGSLVGTAIAILVLVALKLTLKDGGSRTQQYVSNGTALFAPTTIIISLDGFRADFLNRGLTPRMNAFVQEGVSPLYMRPSFPSVTFPNHYTLVTGLYPESHGVVGNTFWDPELKAEFYYTDPNRSLDPKWWGGEPFWATAEKAGIRTAIHMWPGSEAHILGIEPSFLDKFNGDEKLPKKVDRVLEFLDMPGAEVQGVKPEEMRPQLIAAYVPNVDADGHTFGPNSTEIRKTIKDVDNMLDQIFQGLEKRNLTSIVNVIVVSDHGMATTDAARLIQLDDIVDLSKVEHVDGWPLVGLRPRDPADLQSLHDELVQKTKDNPNVDIYLRDVDMPERYHFSRNPRIAPLWVVPKTGWNVVKREEFDVKEAVANNLVYRPRGLHGYDHEHPLMRAIFMARGPAFPHPPNSKVEPFQNIEVYNILCDSVGLAPVSNNGTLRLPLKPVGLHSPQSPIEEPADPATFAASTSSAVPSSVSSSPPPTKSVVAASTVTVTASGTGPTETPPPGKDEGAGDDDKNKTTGQKVQELWDWVTGKIEHIWDKITGSGGGD